MAVMAMAKFRDLATGNILTTGNATVIEQYRRRSERYAEIGAAVKAEQTATAEPSVKKTGRPKKSE